MKGSVNSLAPLTYVRDGKLYNIVHRYSNGQLVVRLVNAKYELEWNCLTYLEKNHITNMIHEYEKNKDK